MITIDELTRIQIEFEIVFKKLELAKIGLKTDKTSIESIPDPILIELRNLNGILTQFLTRARV